jgi:hypothetical protein
MHSFWRLHNKSCKNKLIDFAKVSLFVRNNSKIMEQILINYNIGELKSDL